MRGGYRLGSGRPKGSYNKYNIRSELEKQGIDFGAELFEFYKNLKDEKMKLELFKLLLPYVYVKQDNNKADGIDLFG